ncbi:helix-turn-helix transcriptional regulator [Streptomyces sp. LX-29]|uniref:helix-turn-helix transcriptional regulator n=1 Tax=Streptomyces sp. LX-29 TaxID=2900152 RepID=UPI00240E3D7E|nr:helix-turn-helix transcriptional regulator [Streptomyces sp. LX-29]WFB10853.1 helix-turn-helix transcriptional regulator [Streptomyces sp. LX-29]
MLDLAIAALHEHDPGQLWPPIVVELLRACGGEFLVLESASKEWTGPAGVTHWMPDGSRENHAGDYSQRLLRHCYPIAQHYASSTDRAPVTACQVLGEAEWRNSNAAALTRKALAADHILALPLTDTSKPVRGLLVYRSGSGFTDDHLAYARRVQPLLAGVDRQVTRLHRWRAFGADSPGDKADEAPRSAPRGRAADTTAGPRPGPDREAGLTPAEQATEARLTPREITVLALLADALTAATIGRRLGISVRTAQKHIESIYRKLGTKDRVSTVLRAQSCGLIPTEPPPAKPSPRPRRAAGLSPMATSI